MTEVVFGEMMKPPEMGFDAMSPANISPLVVWLGSSESPISPVRSSTFAGGEITVFQGWRPGPTIDKKDRWDPRELGKIVPDLVARRAPAHEGLRRLRDSWRRETPSHSSNGSAGAPRNISMLSMLMVSMRVRCLGDRIRDQGFHRSAYAELRRWPASRRARSASS